MLREAWLAFGRLLSADRAKSGEDASGEGAIPVSSNANWDSPPLSGRHPVGTVPFSSNENWDSPHSVQASGKGTVPFSSNENWDSPRAARLVPAVVALAVSLLVAATIAWFPRGPKDAVEPPAVVVSTPTTPAPPTPLPTTPSGQQPSAVAQTELAWDDSLDSQIVLAGKAVLGAQEDWSVLADGTNSVHYGIRQIEKDVQGSQL